MQEISLSVVTRPCCCVHGPSVDLEQSTGSPSLKMLQIPLSINVCSGSASRSSSKKKTCRTTRSPLSLSTSREHTCFNPISTCTDRRRSFSIMCRISEYLEHSLIYDPSIFNMVAFAITFVSDALGSTSLSSLFLALILVNESSAHNSTILNPILPGFHPDPSCIFVPEWNNTFFCASSSFEAFPGIPIHASKDLQHWKHVSNVLSRVEQLPDLAITNRSTSGIWAPALRYHKGTFWMMTTLVHDERPADDDGRWDNVSWSTSSQVDPEIYLGDQLRSSSHPMTLTIPPHGQTRYTSSSQDMIPHPTGTMMGRYM